MKKMKKILGVILSICLFCSIYGLNVYAASGSLSISSRTGTVGSNVSISVTISATEAINTSDVYITYDASGLQYVGSSLAGGNVTVGNGSLQCWIEGDEANPRATLSCSLTFKILREGTFRVSGTTKTVSDVTYTQINVSGGSGTITGKAKTTTPQPQSPGVTDNRDGNSKLNSLQVSPGTLSPAFHADTTAYNVTVPQTTTEITIAAGAQSGKSTVTVTGGKDLKPGPNEAKVVVMAENGATTVYVINIMCGEEEKITINGVDNTINENFTDAQIPTGFVRDKAEYKGREYEALKLEKGDLTIINLKNASGNDFYIYHAEKNAFYNFTQIILGEGKYIIPLTKEKDEAFKEYKPATVTIQKKEFTAWKLDEEFSLLYMMNQEGEEVIYRYDHMDGTVQRYAGTGWESQPGEISEKPLWEEYCLHIMAAMGILILILSITLIYFVATRKQRHVARKKRAQKKLEQKNEE